MTKKSFNLALLLLFAFPLCVSAEMVLFEFQRRTDNSPVGDQFAEQSFLEVWDDGETGVGSGQVLFKFINDPDGTGVDGTFTQLFWDDTTGLLASSPDPTFSTNSNHTSDHSSGQEDMAFTKDSGGLGKPPGVENWSNSDTDFNFDADAPGVQKGVERQEMGGFLFTLADSSTTLSDIAQAISDGELRVAMHAQGIGGPDGDSDSFVAVPEPSSAILFASILGFGFLRRRR